jgi:hypothetical protein
MIVLLIPLPQTNNMFGAVCIERWLVVYYMPVCFFKSRKDITYDVAQLSRFVPNPGPNHWNLEEPGRDEVVTKVCQCKSKSRDLVS